MKIYFDNNIIISIEEGDINFLYIKDKYIGDDFVYSYIHIQELLEAKRDKEILIKKDWEQFLLLRTIIILSLTHIL